MSKQYTHYRYDERSKKWRKGNTYDDIENAKAFARIAIKRGERVRIRVEATPERKKELADKERRKRSSDKARITKLIKIADAPYWFSDVTEAKRAKARAELKKLGVKGY